MKIIEKNYLLKLYFIFFCICFLFTRAKRQDLGSLLTEGYKSLIHPLLKFGGDFPQLLNKLVQVFRQLYLLLVY